MQLEFQSCNLTNSMSNLMPWMQRKEFQQISFQELLQHSIVFTLLYFNELNQCCYFINCCYWLLFSFFLGFIVVLFFSFLVFSRCLLFFQVPQLLFYFFWIYNCFFCYFSQFYSCCFIVLGFTTVVCCFSRFYCCCFLFWGLQQLFIVFLGSIVIILNYLAVVFFATLSWEI